MPKSVDLLKRLIGNGKRTGKKLRAIYDNTHELCGFIGLELTGSGVKQLKSSLPSHWKSLTIKGVGPERRTCRVVND